MAQHGESVQNSTLNFPRQNDEDVCRPSDHLLHELAYEVQLTWETKNKHGQQSYLQQAVKVWNKLKVGEKVFKEDEYFKNWCKK